MAADYYEHVAYEGTNFLIAMGRDSYVLTHIHREAELALVLDGAADVTSNGETKNIRPGEFWYADPYRCHEAVSCNGPCTFLILQVAPDFFRGYFPEMERIRIDTIRIAPNTEKLRNLLIECAMEYFKRGKNYTLRCAALINMIMDELLQNVSNRFLSDAELHADSTRIARMQRINRFIEEHSDEKLLLSQIADSEDLTLSYLSHFFSDCFGMPFQTYLSMMRCRKAAAMLLESEATVTDISFSCGFSALKYMNQIFTKVFGETPGEYRRTHGGVTVKSPGSIRRAQMPTLQGTPFNPHLTPRESLRILENTYKVPGISACFADQ